MSESEPSGDSQERQRVGHFFDSLSKDYTAVIERCFPRYREMLWALLDYLPASFKPKTILELGSGTGNLSALLVHRYPNAEFQLVDLSSESIEQCQKRFAGSPNITFLRTDFCDLSFPDASFDLIASSISVHHLEADDKQALFQRIHGWLNQGGIFAYVDQHAGETMDIYARHIANWKEISLAAGSTEEEWEMWMKHQREHDHHDTLSDQMMWLSEAGFDVVDCPWRYLLWTVLQARK